MTRRTGLLAAAIAGISLTTSQAAEPIMSAARASDAGMTLVCGNPVAWDATETDLIARFGAANVEFGDLGGPEGEEMPGTRVNAKDAARKLEIVWEDETARARPAMIRIYSGFDETSGTEVMPVWIALGGVKIGQSLAEVEALNGKPFKMSGFGWDYGGMSMGWEGGKLDTAEPRCDLSVFFSPRADYADSISGDITLSSDDPALRASDPAVMLLTITYRRDLE